MSIYCSSARVRVTARFRVRVRARVISSAACRWFSCGWLQVGQLCLAAVEVGLVLGLELELELGLG